MRFLYSLIMTLLTPFLLIRLWWKGRRLPAYRARWSERFCLNMSKQKVDVWVHAVSLGEVIAARPLIEALLEKKLSLLVTTMTPTGSEQVKKLFADKVLHQYMPYDIPLVLKRFFEVRKPKLGIIMETELWPNLIYQAKKAGVPLVLANARLSQKSLKGYLRFKWFFKELINQLSLIGAQSEDDAKRFIALGAMPELVKTLGNIKFDLQTHQVDTSLPQALKALWGQDRVVFIAASTHEDEESQLLSQLKKLQQAIPGLLFVIAPRHPERFEAVYQLAKQAGFETKLRSDKDSISADTEVVIIDSLGELLGFYKVSHYAFVGGSLVLVGGHNVLEPIAMNIPVISGNHVHNFASICRDLKEAKAIALVNNVQGLTQTLIQLHDNKARKQQMIDNAKLVLTKNQGSLERYLQVIWLVLK